MADAVTRVLLPPSGTGALYRDVEEIDTVFVLALRSQREAGYAAR